MAKSRRAVKPTRKRAPSGAKGKPKRPVKRAKKAPRKRAATLASEPAPERSIDLKALRAQFALMLSGLSKRSGSTPEIQARLDGTRRRVSQWMTDINDICTPEEEEICGPTMVFPIP